MPDIALKTRPVLDNRSAVGDLIRLQSLPEETILLVIASADAGDLSAILAKAAGQESNAVRAAGPGQWLLVTTSALSAQAIDDLGAALSGKAAIVDQSHGRVRILIEGEAVEAVLAKGMPVDLAPSNFPVGKSVTTMIGHLSTHVTRMQDNAFEIIVTRSFAETLWEDLVTMAGEYL
ncbi:sarcosine oxidase subunit gamma family protein [Sinorhizobium sp. BG8]|uniref:sarcosine oxidase subunit gamma family protein n=1 Tax=Sinorhizobium sp. BG8 TaxID=2613773 RepID=UPI001FEDADF4|nr:sarcosine oxidase subunit gamma family protein [Sinorhizobium sp. BG8]